MRRLALINIAVFALVSSLAIRQCCISYLPQSPSHYSHEHRGQQPIKCQLTDEALVDRSATTLTVARAITAERIVSLTVFLNPIEKAHLNSSIVDIGPPDLFLHTSALLI
jgi:hypothetical protein